MKTLIASLFLLILITSCSKEQATPVSSPNHYKVTLCKTPYGIIVPIEEYETWKDYVPGNPKFQTMAPDLKAQGAHCTLANGSKGTECWKCTEGTCNCLNVYTCTYCANC